MADKKAECENPLLVLRGLNSQHSVKSIESAQINPLSYQALKGLAGPQNCTSLHWIRVTIKDNVTDNLHEESSDNIAETNLWQVTELIRGFFGHENQRNNYGRWFYNSSLNFAFGVSIQYQRGTGTHKDNEGKFTLDVPGQALDTMSEYELMAFCHAVNRFNPTPCRLDLAYDDYRRLITPGEIVKQTYIRRDDDVVVNDYSGFKTCRVYWQGDHQKINGDMVTYGSRGNKGSGKYLRIYDKGMESKGVQNCIRYELELSGKKAEKAWQMLLTCSADDKYQNKSRAFSNTIGALIGGSIDFIKRSEKPGEKNLKRIKRFAWWCSIMANIGRVKLRVKAEVKTVEKAIDWMEKQVTGSMQMVAKAKGSDYMIQWFTEVCTGSDRLNEAHLKAVEEYKILVDLQGVPFNVPECRKFLDKVAGQQVEIVDMETGEFIPKGVKNA